MGGRGKVIAEDQVVDPVRRSVPAPLVIDEVLDRDVLQALVPQSRHGREVEDPSSGLAQVECSMVW